MTDTPSTLTDKEAEFIRIIAEGGTVRQAAQELDVSPALLMKWLAEPANETLREHYARAREMQGDDYADRVVETALDPAIDPSEKRVRIDAFKWAAGKRKPKVYGERMQLEQTLRIKPAEQMGDDELAAIASGGGAGAFAATRNPGEPD
jgi:hypothetical protein